MRGQEEEEAKKQRNRPDLLAHKAVLSAGLGHLLLAPLFPGNIEGITLAGPLGGYRVVLLLLNLW